MRLHPLAPVIALDIDGTLGAYHSHFMWFASLYKQERVAVDWTRAADCGAPGEFSVALGMDKREYRDIKLAYRQGGMKRCLPLIHAATKIDVQYLRSMGVQVWITTTRPWNRLDNIDPDTQFWIDRNVGQVDGVIYGEDKYADLVDIVGQDRILGVFDDLPENIERASALGLRSVLANGPHNAWWRTVHPFFPNQVSSLAEALENFEGWISEYNEEQK